jgi:signal transduction histidine kinase/ActR/RegA family two-component response regulator
MSLAGKRDLIGKSVQEVLSHLRKEHIEQALALPLSVYETGETKTLREQRALFDHGRGPEETFFNATFQPICDASGVVTHVMAVIIDVTEHALAKQRLESQNRELRLADTAKDAFLATLSHELRTPLAAILLWVDTLRSGSVPFEEIGRAVDAIAHSTESQSRLIDDLLDLSRLVSGRLVLNPSSVALAHLVGAAVDIIRPIAKSKGVELEIDIRDAHGSIVLDSARIKQVLWNLLSNATKFTPAGGNVKLSMKRSENALEVEVSDTGKGISPEFAPHLFERFRQAETDLTNRRGLGIGLALSKQLIELHGGTIGAYSEGAGRGSVFRFRLPWIEPAPSSHPIDGDELHASAGPSLAGVTVLLVEDDSHTRTAMQWTLERAGAKVMSADGAEEALARLETLSSQELRSLVVVSDLGLTGVSGYEFIERLASRCEMRGWSIFPSCAVSAHARDVDRRRAFDSGFNLYITKPVTPERLVEAVEELRDLMLASD